MTTGTGLLNTICSTMAAGLSPNGYQKFGSDNNNRKQSCTTTSTMFQMPLHYPRFKRSDYETMPEWKLDCLLKEYGLPVTGDVNQKRKFAMGAFLWPSQVE